MPKYVKFDNDLVLVEQEIKSKKIVAKKEPVNHIWIYDRSGSMYGLITELCDQLITLSKKIPKGDSLSLGWFSSEGDFNWVFKGFRIVDNADYKSLEAAIKKNNTTRGTTCFSEILTDTDVVVNDLSVLSKTFSLCLFTDGYPVVSNYKKEVDTIFASIKKIKGKIHTAMLIGCGCYYNKELMAQMSEKLGAMLIHSSNVKEFTNHIVKLVDMSSSSEPKEEVEPLFSNTLAIFSVTDQGVVSLSLDDDKIYVAPEKGKPVKIYYLTTEKPNTKSWDKVDLLKVDFGSNQDSLAKAIYGAALIMSQQTKTDIAMEIVGKAGDKAIIDKLNNAFMVEEFGETEEFISKSVNDVSSRFTCGRDATYLPKADAFCVYDALNMLTEDSESAFFPYHEKFAYEKIGVKSSEKDGYSKFYADKTSKCPFNTLVWHESRLNLSVQTSIKGTIDLHEANGKTAAQMGFIDKYPTYVFRNYTFVKDGHTHTKVFYLTSSQESYKKFKNEGIVVDDDFKTSKVYAIDLGKLPAINRVLAGDDISGEELCKNVLAEQKLKGEIKALKWLKSDVLGDEQEVPSNFTEEQALFLKENGILVERGGVYSPPTDKADPVDFYMAKTFDIKLSGIATLPTVKKVMEKIASNKSRTASEALIETGITLWENAKATLKDKAEIASWFEKTIGEKQKKLRSLRSNIQKTKMAVILGRKWFKEFTSRENCELVVDGIKCVFELGEEKVGY
jgi:hypothetical protein